MGQLADRFKALDKALDVGFADVNKIVDNSVYSARKEIEDTILGFNIAGLGKLNDILGDVADIIDIATNLPQKVFGELQRIWDNVIRQFRSLTYGAWGGSILTALDALSLGGVKQFIIQSAQAGNAVMCANLGRVLDFVNGYDIPSDIMEGLFFNLAADWMNRVCKPMTRQEEANMSMFDIIEEVYPYSGVLIDPQNVVPEFSKLMGTHLRFTKYFVETGKGIASTDTIEKMLNLTPNEVYDNLTPFNSVDSYKATVDNINSLVIKHKGGVNVYTDKYLKLLEVRGMLSNNYPIETTNTKRIQFSQTAADALGSFIRNLNGIDLTKVSTHKLNTNEKSIYDKLDEVLVISNDQEHTHYNHKRLDWNEEKLNPIVDLFTKEEQDYMVSLPEALESFRVSGLSPTTGEFLREGTYYNKPMEEVRVI